jgi:hypothetical protein
MKKMLQLAMLLLIAGCIGTREYVISKSPDCVYETNSFLVVEIPSQKLDIKSCLKEKFGTPEDFAYARKLPEDVLSEAQKFIQSKTKREARIYAAREIGDFILIFVDEKNVADGGFEFIYSKKAKKVIGEFVAGYRG